MGGLGSHAGELINCRDYVIGPQRQPSIDDAPPGGVAFEVAVTARDGGAAAFEFVLAPQEWGLRQGAWQTKALRRLGGG